mgnify:CR=1 FL=1
MKIGPILDLKKWRAKNLALIGDRKVVASISGGKDSTAMALLLKEAEIPFTSFFVDTGWEHEMTVQYVKEYLPEHIGPIRILSRKEGGMASLVRDRGYFPGAQYRYCTGNLKLEPAKSYLDTLEVEPVNAVGIRAQESVRRSKYPEWEYSSEMHCEIWRPIMQFTEDDLIALFSRHGIRPNPLYLLGAPRVGCWPCIFASKRDLRLIATEDPERIDMIADLEVELTNLRRRKDPKAEPITWFRVKKQPILIHDAVDWAFQDTSDRELFVADDRHMGCMRWGMCEFEHPFDKQKSIVSTKSVD